jgi:hypothetical protein
MGDGKGVWGGICGAVDTDCGARFERAHPQQRRARRLRLRMPAKFVGEFILQEVSSRKDSASSHPPAVIDHPQVAMQ